MNEVVQEALIELFKSVADAYDGGDDLSNDVRKCYAEQFAKPEVAAFYGELVDERTMEVFGSL